MKVTGQSNLTNPKIIDHIRTITDVSGRVMNFTYTVKGLLGEAIDGAGSAQPKVFKFQYDMTQGNKNVKLVKVIDPRGHATDLSYYSPPNDDPKFHWFTKTYTNRLGRTSSFAYTDPDGPQGSTMSTVVTDANSHATTYHMDGFGRPDQITDAKNQVTKLGWDAQHNVVRLEDPSGAVSTWSFDDRTGYPTVITNAEQVRNGWSGITLAYQTGMNGRIADLITKQTSMGRKWTFGYDVEGNLTSVTDPNGNSTPTAGDFTTSYTYDTWGQLLTATDANANTTTYSDFDANGYPKRITDPFGKPMTFVYDVRGNVTSSTDALNKVTTSTYDTFGRPLTQVVPQDQTAGLFITTPAPTYDANDNVTASVAPNGAITTSTFDSADQPISIVEPPDKAGDPQRNTTYTYDPVGNLLTTTEPNGNVTADPTDFVTTYGYDQVNQMVSMTDSTGGKVTTQFDAAGNVVTMVDARKNATTDPTDYSTKYEYNANHQETKVIDAAGHTTATGLDRDGLVISTTDQENVTTSLTLDPRGKVVESKVPHVATGGVTTFRTTRYEYDQVGNPTKTITPRGVDTTDDPDDFSQVTVYDKLNRPAEVRYAFDKDDPNLTAPDKTIYTYDAVGNTVKVSAPPSKGQSVRNDTTYSYFDNGWVRTAIDPWDIVTSYAYSPLGQQTSTTLSSAGGAVSRTLGWDYYPDGKLKSRTDDGVPVGLHVVLVDNSDTQNTTPGGSWGTSSAGTGFQGYDYRTHTAGGTDTFTWDLTVPADGTYAVAVRFPAVTGATSAATYDVTHSTGTTSKVVDQTANAGQWISLGSFTFHEGLGQKIVLKAPASGTVSADAVRLVRDHSADPDTEGKTFNYTYDPNGRNKTITDTSSGAKTDTWTMAYDVLNRLSSVTESKSGTTQHTTGFTYDPNGDPLTRTHDQQNTTLEYDNRDAVSKVTVTEPGVSAKVTTMAYTPKGLMSHEVQANGNTVDYQYYLDGLVQHQVEKRSDGTVVNEHTLDYDANNNPTNNIAKTQNADNHSAYLDRTYTYEYDPRDRLTKLTRTAVGGGGAKTENYTIDANGNTVSQTVDGLTTNYAYDRNRLQSATAVGGATSKYNYDPLGRLDTVTSGGQITEKLVYDGFDRTVEDRTGVGAAAKTTRYTYDPFDRTLSRTEKAGTADAKTTDMAYLGLGQEVVAESVAGALTRTYQYGGQGERLSMTKRDGGSVEFSAYGYTARGDVAVLTDDSGNTRATYGYTAYGSPDKDLMTGVDKIDPNNPDKEPYNTYRFNAKRMDPATGNYDMGARDYNPGLNRFLERDMYAGALADIGLATDPFTMNRYAFGGGNPISRLEYNGHFSWGALGHAVLDVAGLVPVVGEVADLANAGWYAAEGDYANAALSAAGAIPFVGWGAAAIKGGKYAYKGIKEARAGAKLVDDAIEEGSKLVDDVVENGGKLVDDAGSAGKAAPTDTPGAAAPKPKPEPSPAPAPAKAADPPPAGAVCKNSFLPGTMVLMASGAVKAIEDVQLGDEVMATDPGHDTTANREVTNLIVGDGEKHLVKITVDTDGDAGHKTASVTATSNHPFWVEDKKAWVQAGDLRPGDLVRDADGAVHEVVKVHAWTQIRRVHNLTVDGLHTYYVVAGGLTILVHNCGPEIGKQVDYFDTNNDLVNAVHNQRLADGATKGKGGNYGAARLDDGTIITGRSGGGLHAEQDLLRQAGNRKIVELFTERAPCAKRCQPLLRDKGIDISWAFRWNGATAAETKAIRADTTAALKGVVNELFSFK
jgi:RHS repeat-associated protein